MANRWGNNGNWHTLFLGSKITASGECSHEIKTLTPWKETYDQPRQHIKKQRHYFANKGPSSQGYSFSNSHVWMWKLDYKEIWVPKNWCFWTVVLEKTLKSPLNWKVIQPVHPKRNQSWKKKKRNQSWIFIGVSVSASVLPMNIQDWLPLGRTG